MFEEDFIHYFDKSSNIDNMGVSKPISYTQEEDGDGV
jgi:hypothetical protein